MDMDCRGSVRGSSGASLKVSYSSCMHDMINGIEMYVALQVTCPQVALVPSAGSTYAYSYHALGELPALVTGFLLTLKYGVSSAGGARSWSDKLTQWMESQLGVRGPAWTKPPPPAPRGRGSPRPPARPESKKTSCRSSA
ncbi:hypothetical protein PF011_g4682 [Phytophthora fragariae]|uniref:Uncharacterized protein n=1 Tax=Phytophthora fragariae TaxID=53985 RepID=A0A6A3M1C4_9STRA|nr:hypothetical protein PF011_g4682 [Phytophthora fragariae]